MVDWGVARRIAVGVSGDPGLPSLPGDLAELCADSERRVVAYTKLQPTTPLPPPEAVDRPGWSDANLTGMRGVLDPIVDRLGPEAGPLREPVRAAAGMVVAAEVGGLVGLMAQRVLGQYDVPPLDPDGPARLLFVAPNLREAAGKLEADEADLLQWVALHEVTHAVQFSSVGWLRAHVAGMLREMLTALEFRVDLKALGRLADTERLREVVARLRREGLVSAALGSERRALLDRIQATMALIEGHAEHVMDAAGADALPNIDALRSALNRRRRERPPLMRVLERILGLDMKMRQYETGKRFCDAVVERGGVEALNRAFDGPEHLPTWEELDRPEAWMARVAA
jgi:coenzyme F420 biosynthesis associated uncharacterized protein